MKISKIPAQLPDETLPGADWADRYRLLTQNRYETAYVIAERMMGNSPSWVKKLLHLRNRIVRPLGLKTEREVSGTSIKKIGMFPVLEESDHRIVLGLDDKHLDFRTVIELTVENDTTVIDATTLIKRHNLLGRIYLASILPFHILIVRQSLKSLG